MREERWLPVVGWEDYYEVSDAGRVRSLDRIAKHSRGGTRLWKGRVLRPHFDGRYCVVVLSAMGRANCRKYVHALVLEAHVGLPEDGVEACHYDDDGSNNALVNLRWDTHTANVADKVRNGRIPKGAAHANAKLDAAKVRRMREAARMGLSQSAIAKEYGVSQPTAGKAIRGDTWSHVA